MNANVGKSKKKKKTKKAPQKKMWSFGTHHNTPTLCIKLISHSYKLTLSGAGGGKIEVVLVI